MKDVEALCERAVIINQGLIQHDGPLATIVGRFSQTKVIELQFASELPANSELERFGTVFDIKSPRLKLRIPRNEVAQTLTALLSRYEIEDVSVQDRPLEEVIAEVFQQEARSPH
jgi:ABC-2 type transport system ATP-binding protein